MTRDRPTPGGLPADIWALGVVSLLMDASSELVHSLLPLFMLSTLGVSVVTIGLVEGMAEATAAVAKVVSGPLSDRWRRRKPLVVLGYGLGALSKPVFPLATSVVPVVAARFVDRVGKGIRGAPRDALIADLAPPSLRGAAYGLRQALDSLGAVIGPGLAMLLMVWLSGDVRLVLWAAVVPALLAVTVLATAVHEPDAPVDGDLPAIVASSLAAFPRRYWQIVAVGVVFTLARFGEAFLVLRADSVGLEAASVPLVMAVMSGACALGAYPAGRLADRLRGRTLLGWGLIVLIAADLILAASTTPTLVMAGAACWGLHMALTHGLFAKLVADSTSARLRGTAFGVFNLATGVATFLASAVAGALWHAVGPAATFYAGALFAALALATTIRTRPSAGGQSDADAVSSRVR